MGSLYRRHIGRRVYVQLVDGSTLAGELARATRRGVELDQAAAVQGERRTPIDGRVLVEQVHILWTQVV